MTSRQRRRRFFRRRDRESALQVTEAGDESGQPESDSERSPQSSVTDAASSVIGGGASDSTDPEPDLDSASTDLGDQVEDGNGGSSDADADSEIVETSDVGENSEPPTSPDTNESESGDDELPFGEDNYQSYAEYQEQFGEKPWEGKPAPPPGTELTPDVRGPIPIPAPPISEASGESPGKEPSKVKGDGTEDLPVTHQTSFARETLRTRPSESIRFGTGSENVGSPPPIEPVEPATPTLEEASLGVVEAGEPTAADLPVFQDGPILPEEPILAADIENAEVQEEDPDDGV